MYVIHTQCLDIGVQDLTLEYNILFEVTLGIYEWHLLSLN